MKHAAYCLFETPLGRCGIAWSEDNSEFPVTSLQLPEANDGLTESRIGRHSRAMEASDPPPAIRKIIQRICSHLEGKTQNFRDIPLDVDDASPFVQRVYDVARKIPPGKTITYGDIAKTMGHPDAVRAVGRALGRNPIPLIIPCHRVVAAHGKPGGFSAYGGRVTKAKLLALEGAVVNLCLELKTEA